MVHWAWLILAFIIGGAVGVFIMALLNVIDEIG